MPDNKKDWFKIYRSLLMNEDLWLSEPFTKGQAWIDLIGRANYGTTERIFGSHCTYIHRGELPTSIAALAKRWRWSRTKTASYLNALQEAQMLDIKKTSKGTTLTIENYAFYQDSSATKKQETGQQKDIKKTSDWTHKKKKQEETKNTQEKECVGSDEPFDPAETDESWREFLKQIGGGNNDD